MGKIGFIQEDTKNQKQQDTSLKNVERDFQVMIRNLGLEQDYLKQEMKIDKRIRKELIKIHKKLRDLEKKVAQRNKLMIICEAQFGDNPKRSLELITEVEQLEQIIHPEANKLMEELSRHILHEVDDFYKDIEVDTKQRKDLRMIVGSLSSTLSNILGPVRKAFDSNQIQNMKNSLLAKHPELK